MKTGIELIAEERERQVSVEGWTPEHDDQHTFGEMAGAALTYTEEAIQQITDGDIEREGLTNWPWSPEWWKPSDDPIRNLVKAGALIAAEVDRLQRMQGEQQ